MTKEIEKWWKEAAKYYQEENKLGTQSAHYGPYSPNENELNLLGKVKGKKILEIGCGGGQCSVAFAKQGAVCTGIDILKEQLEFAENLAKKNKVKVNFIKGDIQTLKGVKSGSFDIVFSAFALQYVPDLTKCFKEVFRVLKKKGLFIFSLDHPFYIIINDKNGKIYKSYYKTGREEEKETWPDGSKHLFVRYRRKVSDMYSILLEAGFFVEKLMEPFKKDTEWKKLYPYWLAKMMAPTIIFKAVKK